MLKKLKKLNNLFNFSSVRRLTQSNQSKLTPEQEWTAIYEAKMQKTKDLVLKELSQEEREEVEFISEELETLSKDEKLYFALLMKIKQTKLLGMSPFEYNQLHPSKLVNQNNLWPKENPNWYKTPELHSTMNSFKGVAGGVVGIISI